MISENDLMNIVGGFNYGVLGVVVGIVVFIIGLVDGYQRPKSCDDE